MKLTPLIIVAVIGVILAVIGFSIMGLVVWVDQTYGIPPYTYTIKVPTVPFWVPGLILGVVGISLTGLSVFLLFWRWYIGTTKEAAKEVITEGIREWKKKEPEEKGKEVIVKIRCPSCHKLYEETFNNCPHCGAKKE